MCGQSLCISGVQASLSAVPGLELRLVDTQPENIRASIAAWGPDVLILEAELLKSVLPLALLPDFPELKLIGIEIETNQLLVISGSSAYKPTPEQLLQVINA